MTYRYCELACGRKLPVRADGIDWCTLSLAVPCDEDWNEYSVPSPSADMRYWNRQVIDFRIKGNVIYCRLEN